MIKDQGTLTWQSVASLLPRFLGFCSLSIICTVLKPPVFVSVPVRFLAVFISGYHIRTNVFLQKRPRTGNTDIKQAFAEDIYGAVRAAIRMERVDEEINIPRARLLWSRRKSCREVLQEVSWLFQILFHLYIYVLFLLLLPCSWDLSNPVPTSSSLVIYKYFCWITVWFFFGCCLVVFMEGPAPREHKKSLA